MNNILQRYQRKLSEDQRQKLKLTDRVVVKNELKDKLIKEIEGFRTRPTSYKELLKVDRSSVDAIVKKVKAALHYN